MYTRKQIIRTACQLCKKEEWTMSVLLLVPFWLILALLIPTALAVGGAYRKWRGRRSVLCPEISQSATIEVDACHAVAMHVLGNPVRKIQSCSRWPEREGCGRECLLRIAPAA
jgi:hypothetical protein